MLSGACGIMSMSMSGVEEVDEEADGSTLLIKLAYGSEVGTLRLGLAYNDEDEYEYDDVDVDLKNVVFLDDGETMKDA